MSGTLVFLFLCLFGGVLVVCAIGFAVVESRRKKQVAGVLKTVAAAGPAAEKPVVLMRKQDDGPGFALLLLQKLDLVRRLETTLSQSGLDWNLGKFGIVTLVFCAIGAFLGYRLNPFAYWWLSALACGGALSCLPYVYVRFKRRQRFAEFEQQFPEALDFLARSMRAGHAFSVSLEMLGEETPDPLGREFRSLFNEQNLGANIEVALANLVRRVPLIDVRFFVSAVLLQRQTGGNLSEILTRLGYVIRERFQLKGKVKAASAHGRMTATILTLMPIALALGLTFMAPTYLAGMAKDPDGRKLLVGAVMAQLVGYYFIRRIINIKV